MLRFFVSREGGKEMYNNQKPSRPTHDLFVLERWNDKQTGQSKQKRRIWAKGWMSRDKHNNDAVMFKFKIGQDYIYVKEILPDKIETKQTGYQADPRGYQPPQQTPAPQPQDDVDIMF